MAMATAWFFGLPALISVLMFSETVLLDLPFFSGIWYPLLSVTVLGTQCPKPLVAMVVAYYKLCNRQSRIDQRIVPTYVP